MIHLLQVAAVLAVMAVLAAVTYRVSGRVTASRVARSALAGLAAAATLTGWIGTARHAALARSAAVPLRDGHKLSPGFILECGFAGTFVVAAIAVLAVSAVLDARRARRAWQAGGAPAGRRARRTAVRGW
jgi:hypothetical protein